MQHYFSRSRNTLNGKETYRDTEVRHKGKERIYCRTGKESELQEVQKHSVPPLPYSYSKPEL